MGLAPADRELYAIKAGTTVATLNQVAYGYKAVELGFADVLVAVAPRGKLSLDDIPLTERAQRQQAIRSAEARNAA